MSTEATQGTGADVADLESMFAAEPDEFPASGEQAQNQQADTQTQQVNNDVVEFDADGNPLVAATPGEENAMEFDENGDPIVDENANQTGELVIPDDHKIVLNIDGKDQEFTFGDLKASAQKFEGANKKFEEAAAIRKEYTEKAQNLGVREGQLNQVLQYYIDQSQQFMAKEPDWAKLIAEDPQGYLVERHNWEKRQAELQQARNVQANVQRQQAEQAAASQAVRVQQAMTDVVKAIPEWSDPQKRAQGAQAIGQYLASQGVPAEMQAQIDSAPVLLIARKAMLYDQAVANAKAKRTNGGGVRTTAPAAAPTQAQRSQGRVERPGAGTPAQTAARQQNLGRANAAKAFNANPSVETLAGLFE